MDEDFHFYLRAPPRLSRSVSRSPSPDSRNGTKRWKQATTGLEQVKEKETLSVVIKATNFNVDMQKQAVEIANIALDTCGLENEIATYVKSHMDELTGKTWNVIVGRNFGSHVTMEQYIHFVASKITIIVFQCG